MYQTMLFSRNRLSFLLLMRRYTAMHPKMTAKKNPFSRTLHPSAEKSSCRKGGTTAGVEIEVGTAGVVGVVSSGSAYSGLAHSACPYKGAVRSRGISEPTNTTEKAGRKVLYSSTWIPSSGTGSSPLSVIVTSSTGLSPGFFGTFWMISTIS